MIMVLTQKVDPHADYVIEELNRRALPVVRFDTADFPWSSSVVAHHTSEWVTVLALPERTVDLSDVTSVWYRRPTRFEFSPTLTSGELTFARSEATMGMGGLLRSMECLWVNHPEKAVPADQKPVQLQLAARCGLQTPRSLITNDP